MMKKGIFLILFLILSTIILSGCGKDNSVTPKNTATPEPAIEVKSEKIIDDYIRDQYTAEKKYKNKKLRITGIVHDKGQFKNSNSFFVLTGFNYAAGKTYAVQINYPTSRVNEVNAVKNNDFVVAEGLCVGIVPQEDPTAISIQLRIGEEPLHTTNTTETQLAQPSTTKNDVITANIKGTDVRMRAGAGTNFKILSYFENGEPVEVLETIEGWRKVKRSNGSSGWVAAQFCIEK